MGAKREELETAWGEIEVQLTAMGLTTDPELALEQLEPFGAAALPLQASITGYQDAQIQLQEAEAELETSQKELETAQEELDDAKEKAEELQLKDWIISVRNDIGDIRGIDTIVDGIFGLSYSMSIIFLLVAIVVCHAAISRMIDEQRMLIGAQKALGFRSGSWKEALLTAAICLAVFLTATYVACANLVRLPATTLLRGEVPVKGKSFFFEKWNSYKKLNLYSRTMIKNVLNDKGRMMTTVMGVVGCISLLVIDSSFGERDEFEKVLDEENISYTVIQDKLKNFRTNGGGWENAHVIAVSDFKELEKYMVVEDIHTKELAEIPDAGVFVSRKCAELNDLSEGSTVEFMDSEGNAREVKIVGVIEHYLPYHLFVTSDSYYESVMEEKTDFSVFLLKGDITGLYEKVRDLDGYLSLKDNSEFEKSADGVNLVILICLLLSAVMALLVLLNQIVMHINRKSRELAVMRINGYTLKETRAYVYKDNVILTLLGLLLGSGFGIVLSYVVVRIIEVGANRYVRTPNIPACLYACGVGALFALIVNLIALRKIKHLNLTNVSGN